MNTETESPQKAGEIRPGYGPNDDPTNYCPGDELREEIDRLTQENELLRARIAELEAMPQKH